MPQFCRAISPWRRKCAEPCHLVEAPESRTPGPQWFEIRRRYKLVPIFGAWRPGRVRESLAVWTLRLRFFFAVVTAERVCAGASCSNGVGSGFLRARDRPTWRSAARGGSTPSQPGLQFGDRSGQVHGALRAQCPLGSGLGAGPTLARLFRAHPPSVGSPHWQWRSGRLHRTREEASEARVDVLGCDLGSAEAGACSAASAGEAADPIRFRPLCGLRLAGWLERGSVRCSWVRFLGGAVLNCWDGGAAKIASSGMADGSHATKVNHFYNG